MTRLAPREQRLAALLILVAVLAFIALAVIAPIAHGFADRAARRDLLLATYARDERIIGQLPSLTRAAALQRREQGRFRLVAADEAAATALLVERLGAAVSAVGGELGSVDNVAAPPGIVRVRVECRLTVPQLPALLERGENGAPLVMVDALAIGAIDDAGGSHPGLLDVRIEASAVYSSAQPR